MNETNQHNIAEKDKNLYGILLSVNEQLVKSTGGLIVLCMEAGGDVFSRKIILSDGTMVQSYLSKSMNRFLTSENMNMYNVAMMGNVVYFNSKIKKKKEDLL